MVAAAGDGVEVRDWVACLVRPNAEHLEQLGRPTWYARFGAQVMTDPALREIMVDEALTSPALQYVLHRLDACLPALPPEVRQERRDIGRHLMVHVFAERERVLAVGGPTPCGTWSDAATGLVDALVGVFVPDRAISWTILGTVRPPIGHVYGYRLEPVDGGTLVTSYCDWSDINPVYRERDLFPIISAGALKATLGILARIVARR